MAVLPMGEAAGLAVGAVGADEDGGAEGFGAARSGDVEFDGVGELAQGGDAVDLAEFDAAALTRGEEGLLEAEVVEALAHGHGADGVAGLDAHVSGLSGSRDGRGSRCPRIGAGGIRAGWLQDDLVADALDDRVDGVAEGLEGLAGEAAGAGFGPREGALVEQDDLFAGLGEVIGRGAACRSCTGDQDVAVECHVQSLV